MIWLAPSPDHRGQSVSVLRTRTWSYDWKDLNLVSSKSKSKSSQPLHDPVPPPPLPPIPTGRGRVGGGWSSSKFFHLGTDLNGRKLRTPARTLWVILRVKLTFSESSRLLIGALSRIILVSHFLISDQMLIYKFRTGEHDLRYYHAMHRSWTLDACCSTAN